MANILDVAPVPRLVPTSKYGTLEVYGLSIEGIVFLIKNHPELMGLFNGQDINLGMDQVLSLGVDIAASFLAAGLGFPGNDEAIARCRKMNPEDAFNIGSAILEESFPGGATNFFQKVTELAARARASVNLPIEK